jgi:hypothetical protein
VVAVGVILAQASCISLEFDGRLPEIEKYWLYTPLIISIYTLEELGGSNVMF